MFSLVANEMSWCVRSAYFRSRSFTTVVADGAKKWDIFGAICVERPPVIARKLNEMEAKTLAMLQQCEFERSLKCDHEINVDKEKKGANKIDEDDEVKMQSFQDLEDAWQEAAKNFRSSCEFRSGPSLDRSLILVTKSKLGTEAQWMLPTMKWSPGETLRQTAERALHECIRPSEETQSWAIRVLGNAPAAFYKFKYPTKVAEKTNAIGGKIFFFRAEVDYRNLSDLETASIVKAKLDPGTSVVEAKWVARDELDSLLAPRKYLNSVRVLVPPED